MKPIHVVIAAAVAYLVYRKRKSVLGDPPDSSGYPDLPIPQPVQAEPTPVKSYYQSRVMLPAPRLPGGLPAATVVDIPEYTAPKTIAPIKITGNMSPADIALQEALARKYGTTVQRESANAPKILELPWGSYSDANATAQAKREAAALKRAKEAPSTDYSNVRTFNREQWEAEDAAYKAAQLQAQLAYQYVVPTPVAPPIPEEAPVERVVVQPFVQGKSLAQRRAEATKAQADWAGEQARLARVKKADDQKWMAEYKKKIARDVALENSRRLVEEEKLRREYEKKEADEKRPGIVKTRENMSPEEQALYFTNKKLWELDKAEYVKANYGQREYDEVTQAAIGHMKTDKKTGKRVFVPSSSGIYQEEAVPELQQKLIDDVAAKYDKIHRKTAPDGKPLEFGMSALISDKEMHEQITNRVLSEMSKGGTFITDLKPFLNLRGEMTKEGVDSQMFTWLAKMIDVGKENMSPSELAAYVKDFVKDVVKRQGSSALANAYLRATDTTIKNDERLNRAYDLAKAQNATVYAIANEITPAAMAKAGPTKIFKDLASRIGEKEVAQVKEGINNYLSRKMSEYAFGTKATARAALAMKVLNDPSKGETQKANDLLAMGWLEGEGVTPEGVKSPAWWANVRSKTSDTLVQSNANSEQIANDVREFKKNIREQFGQARVGRAVKKATTAQYTIDGIDDIAAMEFGRSRRRS